MQSSEITLRSTSSGRVTFIIGPFLHPGFPSAAYGLCPLSQIEGGIDQRDMRQRLRKIAQQMAGFGIVLLAQQANVVANGQEALEQSASIILAVYQHVGIHQPELHARKTPSSDGKPSLDFASFLDGAVKIADALRPVYDATEEVSRTIGARCSNPTKGSLPAKPVRSRQG